MIVLHLAADLDLVDLVILAVGGMLVFGTWIYLICKIVELFTND